MLEVNKLTVAFGIRKIVESVYNTERECYDSYTNALPEMNDLRRASTYLYDESGKFMEVLETEKLTYEFQQTKQKIFQYNSFNQLIEYESFNCFPIPITLSTKIYLVLISSTPVQFSGTPL